MSLAANRRLLAAPEFQRGVAHICSTTGRRDAGSFSCAAGAGAGLMRAAGGGLRDGFGDMLTAAKTCYGVMKLANRHDLPHFAVDHCTDGVFAEWLRYNAKKQLSYSAFGREIAYMCRSRTRSFEDSSTFDHNEYGRCIEALGRQVALKSGFDYSHSVTLCNQLTSDDRELCLASAKNFTQLHEDRQVLRRCPSAIARPTTRPISLDRDAPGDAARRRAAGRRVQNARRLVRRRQLSRVAGGRVCRHARSGASGALCRSECAGARHVERLGATRWPSTTTAADC
jgi:hypothetical protein